jgi:hypothetical protein
MNPLVSLSEMEIPIDPFMQDFGFFMDSMMESALHMPMIIEFVSIGPHEEDAPAPEHEDEAATHVISQIAANTHPDHVEVVADRLVEHGNNLLLQEDVATDKRRMARRLTEVSPEEINQHRRVFLPFGCPHRNRCLQDAYDHHAVSPDCGFAMARLEHVRVAQYAHRVEQLEEEGSTLFQLTALYVFAVGTMLVLYLRRRSDQKETRRLKLNVLKAIYSTPELKAAVEKEIGEPLGHVPPLGMRALLRFGLHGQVFRQVLQAARMMRLAIFSALMGLFLVAPAYFLPVCVGLAAWAFVSVVFGPPQRVRMCACCCCGATTDDAKNDTLTQEQMCCCCCRGTGVCAVACSDCCDNVDTDKDLEEAIEAKGTAAATAGCCCCSCCSGADGCCCCSGADGCCCCSGADGCCCCSGADGCCCSGADGCCCATTANVGCCACCSAGDCCGNCCCCTKKADPPNVGIYEGIPIQIV